MGLSDQEIKTALLFFSLQFKQAVDLDMIRVSA